MVRSPLVCGLLATASLLLIGCLDSSVTFPVSRTIEFSSSDFAIPASYTENAPSGLRVPSVSCTSTAQCPMAQGIDVVCDGGGECNPEPFAVTVAAQDIDLSEVTDTRFAVVDTMSLRRVEYAILTNSFNTDLPELEIWWGPPGVSDIDPTMGVMPLATMPSVPAGTTPTGELSIDAAGNAALTDHLENISPEFRVFLRANVDIDPGDPVPQGMLSARVQLVVTASGRLL